MAWKRCWEKQEEWKPSPPSFPPPSWMTRKGCWEEQEENLKPRPPSFPPPSWMTRKRCWEEQEKNLKPGPPSFPPPSWEEHDKEEEFEYVFEEEWWPEKPPPAVAVPPPPPPIPLQLPLPLPPPPPPVLKQDEVDGVDVLVEAIDGSDDEWHSDGRVNIAKYWQEAWQQQHPNLPVPPPPKPVTVVPDWSDLCKAAAEPETQSEFVVVVQTPDICCQADAVSASESVAVQTQTDVGCDQTQTDVGCEKPAGGPIGGSGTAWPFAKTFGAVDTTSAASPNGHADPHLSSVPKAEVATQTDDAGGFEKKVKEKWHFLDLKVEKEKFKVQPDTDDLNPGDACDAISQVACDCEQPAGGVKG